jgi:hypothetical protein
MLRQLRIQANVALSHELVLGICRQRISPTALVIYDVNRKLDGTAVPVNLCHPLCRITGIRVLGSHAVDQEQSRSIQAYRGPGC